MSRGSPALHGQSADLPDGRGNFFPSPVALHGTDDFSVHQSKSFLLNILSEITKDTSHASMPKAKSYMALRITMLSPCDRRSPFRKQLDSRKRKPSERTSGDRSWSVLLYICKHNNAGGSSADRKSKSIPLLSAR